MSTVVESHVEVPQEQFFPPKVNIGQQVLFYANAERRNPSLAVVTAVGQSTIECIIGNRGKYSVHHVDDPGLVANHNWREFGAWDITDQEKMISRVLDRLADIEKQFAALKADKARQQDGGKR